MAAILRASVSLDGKLLTASGKPACRDIPSEKLEEVAELELTIHPLVLAGIAIPSLSGLPGVFKSAESRWRLLSAVNGTDGRIVVRYRRKSFRAKRV